MNSKDNEELKNKKKAKKPNGTTKISAEIKNIGKDGETEIARVQERNLDTKTNTDSERGFELNLKIGEVKGNLSLADIIRKQSKGDQKKCTRIIESQSSCWPVF